MAVRILVDDGPNGGFSRVVSPVLVLKALVLKIRYLVVHVSYLFVRVLRGKASNDHLGLHLTAVFLTIFKIAFLSDARKRVGTPKSRFRRLRPHTLLLINSLYITSK